MMFKKTLISLFISVMGMTMAHSAAAPEDIAQHLGLVSHPDGGYFKEIYRIEEGQNNMTMIYALRQKDEYSTIHKLSFPEIFQWVNGQSFHITQMSPEGEIEVIEVTQKDPIHIVPADYWFQVHTKNDFSLMTAIVSPAFSWEYFTEISYDNFMKKYPYADQAFKKPFNKVFEKPEVK